MNVKFNKDAILKHRFWIMLGVAGFLVLTGITYLEFVYGGPGKEKELLNKSLTAGKQGRGEYSPAKIEAMQKKADESVKQETKHWAKFYQEQENLFQWADAMESRFNFHNGYFVREIKLTKLSDPKSWPEDKPGELMHGTIAGFSEEGFRLKNRKGETIKFNETVDSRTVTLTDENKQINYNDFIKQSGGKLVSVLYQRGRYFGDMLTLAEQREFRATYKDQIHEILKSADPLDEKSNGVVQLKDWLYQPAPEFPPETAKFIRYVTEDWVDNKDISKDAWIAQENLWIQKEIYRVIRATNDELAVFSGTGGKERNKPYVFTNPSFEIQLNLDAKSNLSFKIRNLLDRQQSIDLNFRVLLNDAPGFAPENIRISGLPLKPRGDKSGKDVHQQTIPVDKSPRNAVLRVQQVLSWQTAAIKRLDQISIGSNGGIDEISHSHRTYVDALRPFDKADLEAAKPATGPDGQKEGVFRPGPGPGPGGKFGGGGGDIGANLGKLEQKQLWSFRYDDVTDQFRRIPVGVVIIVDQDHIDRVLTSFNNSKLRFLTTQVLLNQYTGSLQPPTKADPSSPQNYPGGIPFFPGREMGGPGLKFGGPPEQQPGGGEAMDQETNMELVIYGFMTLYRRYPTAPVTRAPGPEKQ